MPRKKKIEELKQTDGKNETFKPTLLSQIWGDTGMGRYKTLNKDEYTKTIKSMNLADLRKESIRVGIVPNMHRERLEKQLLVEFQRFVNLYQKPTSGSEPPNVNSDKVKKALDILSAVK